MNPRFLTAAVLLTALGGCNSTRLSNELKPYVGRDIHELTAKLGKATGQRETVGDRAFVWKSDSDGVLATTPFSEGAGNGGGVSYAGSPTRAGVMPVHFECTIEVAVDAHNIIERFSFEGSDAGCRRYRQLLSR